MSLRRAAAAGLGLWLAAGGCAGRSKPALAQQPVPDESLTLTLALDPDTVGPGARIAATLRLRNRGSGQATLHFTSGQRYDFRATDSAGRDVWVWSSERSFIQAVGQLVLEGERREVAFTERFAAPTAAGRYRVTGEIVAAGQHLSAAAWLTVSP